MIDPRQVSQAVALFVERSSQAASLGARLHGKLTPEWIRTHRRVMDVAGTLSGEAAAAIEVLLLAAREWGFNINPLTDYLRHPNDETRGAAWALAGRLQERADAEDRIQGALPTVHATAVRAETDTEAKASLEKLLTQARPYAFYWGGDVWEVRFEDERGRYRDRKGFQIIAKLLRFPNPSRPLSAVELAGLDLSAIAAFTPEEALTEEDVADLRHRLEELPGEIDLALRRGSPEKAAELERAKAGIEAYLQQAVNKRDKPKKIGAADPRKSAQSAVTQRVREARELLRERMPKLAAHLDTYIKTGTHCAYRPPSDLGWVLD